MYFLHNLSLLKYIYHKAEEKDFYKRLLWLLDPTDTLFFFPPK